MGKLGSTWLCLFGGPLKMVAFLLVFALKTNKKGYQHQKRRPTYITAKMLMLVATFRGCRHSLVHITNKKNIWYARDLLTALGSLALNEASCVFPADTNAAATSFDRLQGSQGVKKGAVSEVNRPECEVVSLSPSCPAFRCSLLQQLL